jgi:hypothetical protein
MKLLNTKLHNFRGILEEEVQFHRFMNLLSHLGIAHSVIHDDDDNRDEHADLNQLIQSLRHATLTHSIYPIAKDVESFLGIPPAGSDHRKPQHVLFLYSEGKIDGGKLSAFCSIVEGCLPQPASPPAQSAAPVAAAPASASQGTP